MNLREFKSVSERRKAIEAELKVSLKHTGSFTLDESVASTRNCENMIGVTQVPLGIAGPLKIKSQIRNLNDQKNYYIPLATTEGALIASVNRGCKAITASGGATTLVEHVGTPRGPVFRVSGIEEGQKLTRWIQVHKDDLDRIAKQTSSHIALIGVITRMVGRSVFVRFTFDTKDAMGMNMASIATTAMVAKIETSTGAVCVAVAGNFDIDKKPAWLSFHEGRGRRVWAEAVISKAVVADVLKTTPEKIVEVEYRKTMTGSMMAGSLGYNNHAANIVAALYLATGQDVSYVVEGSLTTTTMEVLESGDLYAAVYMPAVMVGTVGGGTGLATQKEALTLLRVSGGNNGENAEHLAKIAGAAVLAGELSLAASLATNTLACAHETLARGKK